MSITGTVPDEVRHAECSIPSGPVPFPPRPGRRSNWASIGAHPGHPHVHATRFDEPLRSPLTRLERVAMDADERRTFLSASGGGLPNEVTEVFHDGHRRERKLALDASDNEMAALGYQLRSVSCHRLTRVVYEATWTRAGRDPGPLRPLTDEGPKEPAVSQSALASVPYFDRGHGFMRVWKLLRRRP